MKQGRVIVGVDFSDAARVALNYAASVATQMGEPLQVVHAWNPSDLAIGVLAETDGLAELLEKAREAAERKLEEWADSVASKGLQVSSVIESGPASRVLPALAERVGASLMVVGRHGHASLAHVFLGSVSERIVRMSPCPVLVVPQLKAPLLLPKRLLIGVDYSNGSREALRAAVGLARELRCERGVVVAHVFQGEGEMWLANWSEMHLVDDEKRDRRRLKNWVADIVDDSMPTELVVIPGHAIQKLSEVASERACDWIVLGVQGRTALASFLIGGTAQRILKLARCPVLVVPPREPPDLEGVD